MAINNFHAGVCIDKVKHRTKNPQHYQKYLVDHLQYKGKMPLKPFTYPLPETRFLHAGTSVYKFKIKYGTSINGEEVENKESIVKELEEAVRVIIANLHDLQPFATRNLIIFPYKSKWESVSKLRFKHGDVCLSPFPYICTMYVESNSFQQNVCLAKEPTRIQVSGGLTHQHIVGDEGKVSVKRKRVQHPEQWHFAQRKLLRNENVFPSCIKTDTTKNHVCQQNEGLVCGYESSDTFEKYGNYEYITPKRHTNPEMESHMDKRFPSSESNEGGWLQYIARSFWQFFGGRRLY
ncbi:membrane-anchored junction protein isoform X2 [Lissotriton helveticus]